MLKLVDGRWSIDHSINVQRQTPALKEYAMDHGLLTMDYYSHFFQFRFTDGGYLPLT